jgi:hypothetical protein
MVFLLIFPGMFVKRSPFSQPYFFLAFGIHRGLFPLIPSFTSFRKTVGGTLAPPQFIVKFFSKSRMTLHGGMFHNGPLSLILILVATTVPVMEFRSSMEAAITVT